MTTSNTAAIAIRARSRFPFSGRPLVLLLVRTFGGQAVGRATVRRRTARAHVHALERWPAEDVKKRGQS